MATNPHFDIPFRFVDGGGPSVAVVEQDSYAEIANGIEIIIRTPQGDREDLPEFGIPRLEFTLNPHITVDELTIQEPRIALLTAAQRSALDNMVTTLTVSLGDTI